MEFAAEIYSQDQLADSRGYDNKQFKEGLLPGYEKMGSLFREKMYLAYPGTAEHFGKLVEFVAIWKRHLDGSLPPEALPGGSSV